MIVKFNLLSTIGITQRRHFQPLPRAILQDGRYLSFVIGIVNLALKFILKFANSIIIETEIDGLLFKCLGKSPELILGPSCLQLTSVIRCQIHDQASWLGLLLETVFIDLLLSKHVIGALVYIAEILKVELVIV